MCVDSETARNRVECPFCLLRLSIACSPNSRRGIAYFERKDRGEERVERLSRRSKWRRRMGGGVEYLFRFLVSPTCNCCWPAGCRLKRPIMSEIVLTEQMGPGERDPQANGQKSASWDVWCK